MEERVVVVVRGEHAIRGIVRERDSVRVSRSRLLLLLLLLLLGGGRAPRLLGKRSGQVDADRRRTRESAETRERTRVHHHHLRVVAAHEHEALAERQTKRPLALDESSETGMICSEFKSRLGKRLVNLYLVTRMLCYLDCISNDTISKDFVLVIRLKHGASVA